MEERNNFAKGKVSTHILSIAGPMIVAQLINVLYNMIDRIYKEEINSSITFISEDFPGPNGFSDFLEVYSKLF